MPAAVTAALVEARGAGVDRNAQQSAVAHHRHRRHREARACHRRARRGRQHLPVAWLAAAHRTRRGHRGALDHEVHQWPQRRGRRRGDRREEGSCRAARVVGQLPRAHGVGVRQLSHAARACARCTCACASTARMRRRLPNSWRSRNPSSACTSRACHRIRVTRSRSASNRASAPSSRSKCRVASMARSASPRRSSCSRWRNRWAASRAWWRIRPR